MFTVITIERLNIYKSMILLLLPITPFRISELRNINNEENT